MRHLIAVLLGVAIGLALVSQGYATSAAFPGPSARGIGFGSASRGAPPWSRGDKLAPVGPNTGGTRFSEQIDVIHNIHSLLGASSAPNGRQRMSHLRMCRVRRVRSNSLPAGRRTLTGRGRGDDGYANAPAGRHVRRSGLGLEVVRSVIRKI
jgi:hypothetical protein